MSSKVFIFFRFFSFIILSIDFACTESTFLNNLEPIAKKIPEFHNSVVKNGIRLEKRDLEKLSDNLKLFDALDTHLHKTNLSFKPKIKEDIFEEFDEPKLKNLEIEIDSKLDNLREKISSLKENLLQIDSNSTQLPLIGYPARFKDSYTNYSPKITQNGINLETEFGPNTKILLHESTFDSNMKDKKKVTVKDPTLNIKLKQDRINKPNWKGSAKVLVKGAVIRDELLDELDEEGRSVVENHSNIYFEPSNQEFSSEPIKNNKNFTFSELEDLSAHENEKRARPIFLNEIPGGENLFEKDYNYQGVLFSDNSPDIEKSILNSQPGLVSTFDEIIKMNENLSKKSAKAMELNNSNLKKKQKKKVKEAEITDFSQSMFSPKSLTFKKKFSFYENNKRDKKFKLPTPSKNAVKNEKKPTKYNELGYSELQFEFSEDEFIEGNFPEISFNLKKKDTTSNKSKLEANIDFKAWNKVKDNDNCKLNSKINLIRCKKIEEQDSSNNLNITKHYMPSRAKNNKKCKKLPDLKNLGRFVTQNQLSTKKQYLIPNLQEISKRGKAQNFETKDTSESSVDSSAIFENDSTKPLEYSACTKILKNLLEKAKKVEEKHLNTNLPYSGLPPRRNKK